MGGAGTAGMGGRQARPWHGRTSRRGVLRGVAGDQLPWGEGGGINPGQGGTTSGWHRRRDQRWLAGHRGGPLAAAGAHPFSPLGRASPRHRTRGCSCRQGLRNASHSEGLSSIALAVFRIRLHPAGVVGALRGALITGGCESSSRFNAGAHIGPSEMGGQNGVAV